MHCFTHSIYHHFSILILLHAVAVVTTSTKLSYAAHVIIYINCDCISVWNNWNSNWTLHENSTVKWHVHVSFVNICSVGAPYTQAWASTNFDKQLIKIIFFPWEKNMFINFFWNFGFLGHSKMPISFIFHFFPSNNAYLGVFYFVKLKLFIMLHATTVDSVRWKVSGWMCVFVKFHCLE